MKDELGKRIKEYYENRTRYFLPRKSFIIIRIDGKAFHTYTKGLERPFDEDLINDMNETTKFLCEQIQGCLLGYVQSDEISLLLSDLTDVKTEGWFDWNIQKMASVSASLATGKFNELRPGKLAFFDSRVFNIPNIVEVQNYFIWRQKDAIRNSISSVAQSLFSHKELNGKSTELMKIMSFDKGVDWESFDDGKRNGRIILKKKSEINETFRSKWHINNAIDFVLNEDYILNIILNQINYGIK